MSEVKGIKALPTLESSLANSKVGPWEKATRLLELSVSNALLSVDPNKVIKQVIESKSRERLKALEE